MKKLKITAALCALLLLTGCASLLERQYSTVEPHSSKFWESEAADTLRAENHQDLVNDLLASHNEVHWHWTNGPAERTASMNAQVYITSVNGLAETGELINIDGAGNRVAGTLFGHEKVYFVVGRNKLAPTYDQALWRARNIAAPKNAQRLNCKTPCAVKGDRCYDCKSPDRICRSLVVLWGPPIGMETEVVLVDEDLGF